MKLSTLRVHTLRKLSFMVVVVRFLWVEGHWEFYCNLTCHFSDYGFYSQFSIYVQLYGSRGPLANKNRTFNNNFAYFYQIIIFCIINEMFQINYLPIPPMLTNFEINLI